MTLVILWLASCTGLRKVPEGEYLYTGSTIRFDTDSALVNKYSLVNTLEDLESPKPNTKLLGMRPFLVLHNMVPEPKKDKGVKHYLKYKIGEEPVYLSDMTVKGTTRLIVNRMYHHGYFNNRVTHDVKQKKKSAHVVYNIEPHIPYRIDTVGFDFEGAGFENEISDLYENTLLEKNKVYSLDLLKKERIRITEDLRSLGYYFLSADHFGYRVDTSNANYTIKLQAYLKDGTPSDALKPFDINDIWILANFNYDNYQPTDTIITKDGYKYLQNRADFRPEVIARSVYLKRDEPYSRRDHNRSLNFLMGLGVFRYTSIDFTKVKNKDEDRLDATIYLPQLKAMSAKAEANAVSKSNSFAGPGINLGFQHRNLFGGAENLTINILNRFEWQVGGAAVNTNYEFGVDATLRLAGFYPFQFNREYNSYVPVTMISTGFHTARRVGLFQLNSFNIAYGFNWKSTVYNNHTFRPIDISYVKLARSSAEFEEYLENNPIIRRSFSEQFILGSNYSFTYNSLYDTDKRHGIYLKADFDVAGNLAHGLANLFYDAPIDPENGRTVLGLPYAQFAKTQLDMRYYFKLDRQNSLAFRFIAGVGVPYGNASTLPFVKQFFVGGPNSIRAFQARTVGPGGFISEQGLRSNNLLIDQSGDVKLEGNAEFRFDILKYLKGAVFVDAGNIWLINEDPIRPGSGFEWNDFYREIAMGTGFGLRIDADVIVVRFDLAFPLRVPGQPENERWVVDRIRPHRKSWRQENLLLNIAIGYPF
ncbi:MAG: BamA/TamA family outer membrane protein [Cyclobacteriaceae bacterium]